MKLLAVVTTLAIAITPAASQTPAQGLKFDVATIKPSTTVASQMATGIDPSRFAATGASLVRLVSFAYGVRPNQIIGGPKWVNEELYEIVAKVENQQDLGTDASTLFRSTYRVMVQALLADRFDLKIHKEAQDLSVYSLVIDKRVQRFNQPVSKVAS
jgi:uncharacterized protein (TIGR03435 family)